MRSGARPHRISALSGVSIEGLSELAEVSALIASGQVANYDSVGAFSRTYYTTWGETLQDYALVEDMPVEDCCSELDNGFAAAGK